jgi:heterodisulfide reductase subunit C
MRDLIWERCVLCTRCYCPVGIDIPDMLALARRVCRSQGVYPQYDKE